MNLIKKTSNVGNLLKATSYVSVYPLPSDSIPLPVVSHEEEVVTLNQPKYYLNHYNVYSVAPPAKGLRAIAGVSGKYTRRLEALWNNITNVLNNIDNCMISVPSQIRFLHTDVKCPDFKDYRLDSTRDPTSKAKDSFDRRRTFMYLNTVG